MNEQNVARFEQELGKVNRDGMDKLLAYIRKSVFYTAPASTHYHLSCEGGLLQHSLNVLDSLRGLLVRMDDWTWAYQVAGKIVDTIPDESVVLTALLHDICKTYFYSTSTRNVKNEQTGKWEKAPYYTVNDRMPLGHGPKSAMIVKTYISLDNREMYAIWWHMGFSDGADTLSLISAIEQYPFIWALHTADMMASHMMEDKAGNQAPFADLRPADGPGEWADESTKNDGGFYEAYPLEAGA